MSKDPKKWIIAAIMAVVIMVCINVHMAHRYSKIYAPKPDVKVDIRDLIDRVEPSVVYIETYGEDSGPGYIYNGKLRSGSGVIIREDGLILTAAHMVEGADRFKITLSDGRELWSEDSWHRSEISDVGFIKLEVSEKLLISYLGKFDGIRKGDPVFVIGNPLGDELLLNVTAGIVSGLDRDFDGFFGDKLMFNVDAQSWPGNSGGPVYDISGEIIGILVGGYTGYDGANLCVPVNVIYKLLDVYDAERALDAIK